jgi:hypothetical protein
VKLIKQSLFWGGCVLAGMLMALMYAEMFAGWQP